MLQIPTTYCISLSPRTSQKIMHEHYSPCYERRIYYRDLERKVSHFPADNGGRGAHWGVATATSHGAATVHSRQPAGDAWLLNSSLLELMEWFTGACCPLAMLERPWYKPYSSKDNTLLIQS